MDDFSYDDDGIPEIFDASGNNSSYSDGRIKNRKPSSAFSVDDGSSAIEGPGVQRVPSEAQFYQKCDDSKAVFTIDGVGYDVTLSEKRGKIIWSPMNSSGPIVRKKSARKRSGIFRGRRSSVTEDLNAEGIYLTDLFGVQVKRRLRPGAKDEEGVCLGLVLSTAEHKDENTLREKTIFMEHPSNELCSDWEMRIQNYIKICLNRPRSVKLFLQPYAGSKTGRTLYFRSIMPIFKAADVSVDMVEIVHNEFVKQEMIHVNLSDYECIVCMGGDGAVSQVVDALMSKVQKDGEVNMKQGAKPVASPLPFGIIPIGRTNNVAQSVMGCADPVTAALHIIHGVFQPVDICSIYGTDKFLKWGFNSQYGFAGQVLTFMRRYKALGSKRVNAAFVKALTKSKLRAYECDIEFIPADVKPNTKKEACTTGCKTCITKIVSEDENEDKDLVQEFDPMNQSFTSNHSSIIELDQDNPWRSLKGKFMNVGLFVSSGLCDIAPQGLSKYTHLSDGTIDLVLVKAIEKKEFVRYLKRHGNSKDQFDFPFVDVYKAKEIRLRPRFPMSWNYNDHDFNEIKYQMEKQESKVSNNKSMEVIADLASDEEMRNSYSIQTLDLSDDDDGDEDDSDNSKENAEKTVEDQPRLVGPQYRKTFTEIEIAKRKKIARKKEEKQKAREESKMMSVWNIDNQIEATGWLDFKVHHGLLKINGCGVSPCTEYNDVKLTCLP